MTIEEFEEGNSGVISQPLLTKVRDFAESIQPGVDNEPQENDRTMSELLEVLSFAFQDEAKHLGGRLIKQTTAKAFLPKHADGTQNRKVRKLIHEFVAML